MSSTSPPDGNLHENEGAGIAVLLENLIPARLFEIEQVLSFKFYYPENRSLKWRPKLTFSSPKADPDAASR
ncbi:MAG: hypothetical protein N2Z69_03945 [Methylophilaceae bacterium]|nr:hypothetical protein [Methylophilaceae bacterium]